MTLSELKTGDKFIFLVDTNDESGTINVYVKVSEDKYITVIDLHDGVVLSCQYNAPVILVRM